MVNRSRVRIVLCRPQHPGNIGAAARAMKTMGLADLRLVAPEKFPAPEARWMATNAIDVLDQARVHANLAEAIVDCAAAFALSARPREWSTQVLDARAAAPDGLQADEPGGVHRVQLEAGLAQHGLTLAWAQGGDHADRTKELLGQPPVLGRGPATDVATREHGRSDRPGIIQRHIGRFGFDGYRNVGAPANTRQPARTRPDCQSAGSRCRRQPKGGGSLAWRHDGRAVAQQFAQLAARRRTQAGWCHALYLKRVNVRNVDVSSL